MRQLFFNVRTLVRDSNLRWAYCRYLSSRLATGCPGATTPLGGHVMVRTFTEYLSAKMLMPSDSEMKFAKKFSAKGSVFIDVGANIGVWTVVLGKINPNGTIFAFEPTSSTFSVLEQNVLLNYFSNVHCENYAVSDTPGTVFFEETRNSSVSNRILPRSASHQLRDAHVVAVNATSLDKFCEERSIPRISFLKIDVEGAEPLVIRGMKKLLSERRVDSIYIEIEPGNLEAMGFTVQDLVEPMHRFGYVFHRLENDGKLAERLDFTDCREIERLREPGRGGGNAVCLPC